jgi:hypothetical protein
MTREIDGFTISPHTTETIMAQRLAEPRHEYVFGYTPEGVKLLELVPGATTQGDHWDEEARRYEGDAVAAAKKYRDQLFGSAGSQ